MPTSVIIPIYSHRKRLCRAVESVLDEPEVGELTIRDAISGYEERVR